MMGKEGICSLIPSIRYNQAKFSLITTRKLRPKEPGAQGLTIRQPILILGDSIAFLIGNK